LADLKAASSPDWTRSLSHSFPCLPPRRFFLDASFGGDCHLRVLRWRARIVCSLFQAEYPRSAVLNSCRRLKLVQRDLGWPIEPHGHNRRACADRGVATKFTVSPGAFSHVPRQLRIKGNWNSTWQANLAAVSVPAQHHVEA